MIFYKFFPGDFARDTGHLTLAEDAAYRRLLDHYYATGAPLPADRGALYRICRAQDETERKAVDSVATEFFIYCESGGRLRLHNKRADKELQEYAERHEKLSNSAKKAMRNRWGADKQPTSQPIKQPIAIQKPEPEPEEKKKKPAAKTARPPDPRHSEFVKFAHEAFEAKYGQKPSWLEKDWKGLKNLLASNKSLGLEELQARWQNYLASTEAFTVKKGGSLAYFCSCADSFITGPVLEKGKANGNAKPTVGDAMRTTLDAFRQLEDGKAN